MIILGIDPGTTRMGYGVIKSERSSKLIACGILGNETVGSQKERLGIINKELEKIILKYKPDMISIEKLFFSKNKKTALSVAEARGVVLAVSDRANIPTLEFGPSDIKRVVAGDGRCDKRTLARIVALTLGVESIPGPDDVSDALAVAIRASFEPNIDGG